MTEAAVEQTVLDFCTYPPIGDDDWRYVFETAVVRSLELKLLNKTALSDMANAENFSAAVDSLTATEYALPQRGTSFAEIENMLQLRRTAVRELFAELMLDEEIVELFKARDDFANLRLATRRKMTDRPLGTDYSQQGNISPELLEQLFEPHQQYPDYIIQAAEQAVLAYYQHKDIRQIDYAIDAAQAEYNLKTAEKLGNTFLSGLFRIQIDLTNIRTMFRLKFTESEQRNVFLNGGFIALDLFRHGLDVGYEIVDTVFFATPFHDVVQAGAHYLISDKSFLAAERKCDEYLAGFLKSAAQITAGSQPVIAYLLLKEHEIRTVRLILTAKNNALDTKLILDRVS